MMTLNEIIESVRDGGRPDYEDLRYAICAMAALQVFDSRALMKLAQAEREGKKPFMINSAEWQWEEYFNRHKRAGQKPPKEYVGWSNDPDNPDYLERRKVAMRIADAAFSAVRETGGAEQ